MRIKIYTGLIIIFLFITNYSLYGYESPYLFLIRQDNKWGYIDIHGNIIIPLKEFDCCFSDTWYNESCCTQFIYKDRPIIMSRNNKYGVINLKGDFIISPQYDLLEFSRDSFLIAQIKDKWGVIDINNNVVIPFIFDSKYHLKGRDNIGTGQINDTAYLINYDTKEITKTNFNRIAPFFEKRATFKSNNYYGYINTGGKVEIEAKFQLAYKFVNGLASVKFNDKWGFIDTLGNFKIPPIYEFTYGFEKINNDFFAVVEYENQYGLIDTAGNFVLPPMYNNLNIQSDNVILAKKSGYWGVIDLNGEWIVKNKYYELKYRKGCVTAAKKGKYGVINLENNKVVIPFKYNYIDKFDNEGLTRFYKHHKRINKSLYGYFDNKGEIIWKEKKIITKANTQYSKKR